MKALAIIIALVATAAQAQTTCTTSGNYTFCSDGRSYVHSGNSTFGSDGSSAIRSGGTTIYVPPPPVCSTVNGVYRCR